MSSTHSNTPAAPEESIFRRLGIGQTGDSGWPLRLTPYPELCHRGVVRPSVLALLVDMGAGFAAEEDADTDWTFTTDLSLRAPARSVPESVLARPSTLRAGRSLITSDVTMEAAGQPYAYGQANFTRMPRRHGDPEKPHIHGEQVPVGAPIEAPFQVEVGVEIDPSQPGVAVLELRDALRNPAGVLQGAIVALVGEVAAEALADQDCGTPQIVTDLDIRYLAMGRVGPMEARASWIGGRGSGSLRIDLRDQGNGNRITSAMLARVSEAPAPL